MTISIHLISVPSDEVVTSRVVYLPKTGGEFGRATSCDISLPDQSKRISRVHGSIRLTDNGYSVKSTGQNSAVLNDKSMAKGKEYPLSDGDIPALVDTNVATAVGATADATWHQLANNLDAPPAVPSRRGGWNGAARHPSHFVLGEVVTEADGALRKRETCGHRIKKRLRHRRVA